MPHKNIYWYASFIKIIKQQQKKMAKKKKNRGRKKKTELMVGGQAVIEGVMMRTGDEYAIAVRKPNKKIIVKKHIFFI